MTARVRRALRRDDGASAVEFALVVPILVMLVFGIIAFGIVFAQSLALGNSAREGARMAVVQQGTCAQILASVQSSAGTLAMAGTSVSVEVKRTGVATPVCPFGTSYSGAVGPRIPCQGSTSGDQLTVTAKYRSNIVVPLATSNTAIDLNGTGVFRCEFS